MAETLVAERPLTAGASGSRDNSTSVDGLIDDLCGAVDVLSSRLSVRPDVRLGDATPRQINRLSDKLLVLHRRLAALEVRVRRTQDANEEWKVQGFRSPAEWRARHLGISPGAARRQRGVERRLARTPDTAAALGRGDISLDQADLIADAATVNPDAEADLLELARRESNKGLADEALRRKAEVEDQDAKQRRIHNERSVRCWTDRHGVWNLLARGTVLDGAAIERALEAGVTEQFRAEREVEVGERRTRDQHLFDHVHGAVVGNSEVSSPSRMVILRVDVAALTRGRPVGREVCEVRGVGPISVAQARSVLGDAVLKLVLTRGRDVVHVTHLGRGTSIAQKVALLWSDTTCRVEGCDRQVVEHDHNRPWAENPQTVLSNIDPLCWDHHRRKTNEGWSLVAGSGKRRFVPPSHPDHPSRSGTGTDRSSGDGHDPPP